MRIAVASQNFRTVTGHAGKSRRFLVFEAERGARPREVARLDLLKEMSIHEFQCDGPHPLFAVDAVIAGSAGAGFVRRMAEHGVTAVATAEPDPATAVAGFLDGTLAPAAPHDHASPDDRAPGSDARDQDHADDGADCCCGH
ncbi:nitrogen fixation protein [Rhodoplanes elegans]|uniref:Nitrogen fixation protein n=1 Tax=Rhodoplanes elegans TaxID=29408 RepID=A0A327KVX8_9BRAD|nr:nitrogen fixation protein [Rhodoplanes elegans]MBK5959458.1 nitrogen fixation protein [Rhodoplanes elegans]RAI39508.1 nitrogen fixation protein [Rhodoplanes elegans]